MFSFTSLSVLKYKNSPENVEKLSIPFSVVAGGEVGRFNNHEGEWRDEQAVTKGSRDA